MGMAPMRLQKKSVSVKEQNLSKFKSYDEGLAQYCNTGHIKYNGNQDKGDGS